MSSAILDPRSRPISHTGFNGTILALEIGRILKNRRTLIFTLVFPIAMLFIVTGANKYGPEPMNPQLEANVGAYITVSMALYGAILAVTSAGASVAVDRASGWSRQMRLTPLNPLAYISTKIVVAVLLGLLALAATYVAGGASGVAVMSWQSWVMSGAAVLVGSLVFAAFGLLMGYLIPSDNVMQFVGPGMALLGFLGGLFQGPVDTGTLMGKIQSFTPIFGLSQIAHWPLSRTIDGHYPEFHWWWVANLLVWGAVFVAGSVWRFTRDTKRV